MAPSSKYESCHFLGKNESSEPWILTNGYFCLPQKGCHILLLKKKEPVPKKRMPSKGLSTFKMSKGSTDGSQ